jgi:S1-C subfamily serine protease
MEEKSGTVKTSSRKPLGIEVQDLTPDIASALALEGETGVVVTRVEPGSPADRAGIRRGDLIQELDRKPIQGLEDFRQKVEETSGKESILFLIRRGESNLFAAVTPK